MVYYLILAGVGYTVFLLAVYTKPELVDALPSLRKFFLWAAPIFAGLLLLYSMIKPLASRSKSGDEEARLITPEKQPLIYAFVDEIARAPGTAVPAALRVDAGGRVRAERRGPGEGVELTVGMSLVAASTATQLMAAVAAELAR